MELLKKGSARVCLSFLFISLFFMERPAVAMRPKPADDGVTGLYIIPVASKDTAQDDVSKREWQVLLTRDSTWCCGLAGWKFLYIPFKKLFFLNGIRSFFGNFTFEQKDADEHAYQALSQLTHDKMGRGTVLYNSLIRGQGDVKSKSLFVHKEKNAQYFFVPVEYVSDAALNPRKRSEAEFTMQWMDPQSVAELVAGSAGEVDENTAAILKTYWPDARQSIVETIQKLEEANREYRVMALIREQSPEKRWDQLKNTLEISKSSTSSNLLDPSRGVFTIEKDTYNSPVEYYKKKDACKPGISAKELITCRIKNIFTGNFYKFKQDDASRQQLIQTRPKILVYPDIADPLLGVGGNYRGLNHQGRMLMFFRDHINTYSVGQSNVDIAYTAYMALPSSYSISNLFASGNWRNVFVRWIIKLSAGELFGYKR